MSSSTASQAPGSEDNTTDTSPNRNQGNINQTTPPPTQRESEPPKPTNSGAYAGLTKEIRTLERGLNSLPEGHVKRPTILNQLGGVYHRKYKHDGNLDDVDKAIEYQTKAIDGISEGGLALPIWLGYIGAMYSDRFKSSRNLADIGKAIELQARAIPLMKGYQDLPVVLGNLGVSYHSRFEYSNQLTDIESGIEHLSRAVSLAKDEDAFLPNLLGNLGSVHDTRFERLGLLIDTETAIKHHHRAVALTPGGHAAFPIRLGNLGTSHFNRFGRLGEPEDINKAIEYHQQALDLTPRGHESLPIRLNNLGASYRKRFESREDLADIDNAIVYYSRAVEASPETHESLPVSLSNLGVAHNSRFERLGETIDIEKSSEYHARAISLMRGNGASQTTRLGNQGTSYLRLFIRLGDVVNINKAIECFERVVELTPNDHVSKPQWLSSLGSSYRRRFKRLGSLDDLNKATECEERAVSMAPDGHADLPTWLSNLGMAYRARFERLGELSDINAAIERQTQAISLSRAQGAPLSVLLSNLGTSYETRFERLGESADIDQAIQCHTRAVELTPEGHAKRPSQLNNLGSSYDSRFDRYGKLSDLDKAIDYYSRAAKATPDGHSDLPTWLCNLGGAYLSRFRQLDKVADINEAVACNTCAVELTPHDDSSLPTLFSTLGFSHSERFARTGIPADIEKAIKCHHSSVRLAPDGHAKLPIWLGNLGSSYALRFKRLKDPADNTKAIEFQTQAVSLTSEDDVNLPAWLSSLAASHIERFEQSSEESRDPADVEKAIEHLTRAVGLIPKDHPSYPAVMGSLGHANKTKFERLKDRSSLTRASECFEAAAESRGGHPGMKLQIAYAWAQMASSYDSSNELKAYKLAMAQVPQLVWLGSTLQQRYQSVREIKALGAAAASAAIRADNYGLALEWLEQARSVVWAQILQLNTSVDHLRSIDKALADKFEQVARGLHTAGSFDHLMHTLRNTSMHEKIAQRHHQLAEKYDRLLLQIRQIPECKDFLKPKAASELLRAASRGPVVVVNCDSDGSDALVLKPGSNEITHIALPGFAEQRAIEFASVVDSLLGSLRFSGSRGPDFVTPAGHRSDTEMADAFKTLWSEVAKPILDSLGYTQNTPSDELPHVTWCLAGALSRLPLHAAGSYSHPKEKVTDFVVSSFTPTLGVLISSRVPASVSHGSRGILAIGQPNTPGQDPLKSAIEELATIKKLAAIQGPQQQSTPYADIIGASATPPAVLGEMENYSSVHLSCHAIQNTADPSKSCFYLHEGTLSIAAIRERNFKGKNLAFLSACQTAVGDRDIPDEAVHLAASMLAAGYPSVIATMWSILDEDAPLITENVYRELLKDGSMDTERAARALHSATAALRNKIERENSEKPEEKRNMNADLTRWAPFIHMGLVCKGLQTNATVAPRQPWRLPPFTKRVAPAESFRAIAELTLLLPIKLIIVITQTPPAVHVTPSPTELLCPKERLVRSSEYFSAKHPSRGRMLSPIFEFISRNFLPDDEAELHPIPNEPSSNLFALVIGINKYQRSDIGDLRGAIADAHEVDRYLRERLRVPKDQITTLYDLAATRSEIIQALKNLAADPRIKQKDPIIIYYAGHGSEQAPPAGLSTDQKIQSLVPSDEGSSDPSGNLVECIPDYTLATLLNNLAQAKGDNVTVIFDSCHSSSGTRDDVIVRRVDSKILTPLRLDTDRDIVWPGSSAQTFEIPEGQTLIGSKSYVWIAACGTEETAKETPGNRGVFTEALLEVLNVVDADAVTYVGLLDRLCALPNQKPRCEGENRQRVMFNAEVAGVNRQFVRVLKSGEEYSLQAGAAQGIKVGAHFDVHGERVLDLKKYPKLGSFVVKSVGPRQSTLAALEPIVGDVPVLMYARRTLDGRSHQLLVFFTEPFVQKMNDDIDGWKTGLGMSKEGAVEFGYAQTESEAGLVVGLEGRRVTFCTRNPLLTENGLTHIPHTTHPKPQDVLTAIRAAAKWHWHVNRTNPDDPFRGKIRIEMTCLEQWGGGQPTPFGSNLNGSSGVVNLVERPEYFYGFKLVNESNYDLYPYLFYFDANDQSIYPLFKGAGGGVASAGPQLPRKVPDGKKAPGELTLGYGSGGVGGMSMRLANNEEHGVVVLKLFVTTKPANLDVLELPSPFVAARELNPAAGYDTANDAELWGTDLMIVSQRKTPKLKPSLQHQVDEDNAPHEYWIVRSLVAERIRCPDYGPRERFWFKTPPMSADNLAAIRNMRLTTTARDERSRVAGASWFDIRILNSHGETKNKSDGKPYSWKSHVNTWYSANYVPLDGPVFDEHHEIREHLKAGDCLQVMLMVEKRNTVNDASEGFLKFW
ncbi:hypothetical protein BDV93DRAFT_608208 [Ceratobasidium sp. AG-I]|nr:hypothetical protein BDV93DRAFT_608208 [Ceratobasidium sp. AG-I]